MSFTYLLECMSLKIKFQHLFLQIFLLHYAFFPFGVFSYIYIRSFHCVSYLPMFFFFIFYTFFFLFFCLDIYNYRVSQVTNPVFFLPIMLLNSFNELFISEVIFSPSENSKYFSIVDCTSMVMLYNSCSIYSNKSISYFKLIS